MEVMSPVTGTLFKMTLAEKAATFCKNNVVALTLVPLIVGVHYGWYKLQEMPYLVKPEEKRQLPIVLGAKKLLESVVAEGDGGESAQQSR